MDAVDSGALDSGAVVPDLRWAARLRRSRERQCRERRWPTVKCPFCNGPDTQVIDSRESEEGESIRRRRRCVDCEKRFTTYETVELRMPQMIKSNGNREVFSEDKLRTGFLRALHRRPVPTNLVEDAISRIVQKLLSLGEREVQSRRVGEMVMKELYKLDKVAYIRFASVYKDFQDVDDFRDAIKEVQKPVPRRKRQ
jgi:transcriptional repressor NrdR